MLKITKNKIAITRGDSAYIEIGITNPDGTDYVLQDGDSIQCQVRRVPNTGHLLIDASFENGKIYLDEDGTILWHILPDDTRFLEIGSYSYDIQLTTANNDVFTFISDALFKITNEVTWNE